MGRRSLSLQEADARTRLIKSELAREIRSARLSAGLSLRAAAPRAGMSYSQLGRIERDEIDDLGVSPLSRACAAVGLRLIVRSVPGNGVALDAGQLALLNRLRAHLPATTEFRTEVPLPIVGDRRAWDGVMRLAGSEVPVEAEARLRDIQELDRRYALKRRDAGIAVMVLLVSDTRHNRGMLELHREALRGSFPLDSRAVLAAVRAGRSPSSSGIVVL